MSNPQPRGASTHPEYTSIAFPVPVSSSADIRALCRDTKAHTTAVTVVGELAAALRQGSLFVADLEDRSVYVQDDAVDVTREAGLPDHLRVCKVILDRDATARFYEALPDAWRVPNQDSWDHVDFGALANHYLGMPYVYGLPTRTPNEHAWAAVSAPMTESGPDTFLYCPRPHTLVLPRPTITGVEWARAVRELFDGDATLIADLLLQERDLLADMPLEFTDAAALVDDPVRDHPMLSSWADTCVENARAWSDAFNDLLADGERVLGSDHPIVTEYRTSDPRLADDTERFAGFTPANFRRAHNDLIDGLWVLTTSDDEILVRAVRHGLMEGVQREIEAERLSTAAGWVLQKDVEVLAGKRRVIYADLLHPDEDTLDLLDVAHDTARDSVRNVAAKFVTTADTTLRGVAAIGEVGRDTRGRPVVFSPDLAVWAVTANVGDEADAEADLEALRKQLQQADDAVADAMASLHDADLFAQEHSDAAEGARAVAHAREHLKACQDTKSECLSELHRAQAAHSHANPSRARTAALNRVARACRALADHAVEHDLDRFVDRWQETATIVESYVAS